MEIRAEALKALENEFGGKEYDGYDRRVPAEWWVTEESKEEFLSGRADTVECRVLPEGCDEEKFTMSWDGVFPSYSNWNEV